MKKILIIIGLFLTTACNTNSKTELKIENNIVSSFLLNVKNTENETELIKDFQKYAEKMALSIKFFDKGNIKDILEETTKYKNTVIIIENHTIVKIININDCKDSGSWGACMPIGEGFIKKGKLNYTKDYINNIIGLPDSQKRKIYFFN